MLQEPDAGLHSLDWRRRSLGGLRRIWRAGLDFLLPPRCLTCDAPSAEPDAVCPSCWGLMPFIEAPWCARYGTPLSFDLGPEGLSARAIASPPLFNRARAATLYGGPARDLVLALKFGGRREVAAPMGRLMAAAGRELFQPDTLVLPVPLHRTRLWQRRFNQAALLGQEVARIKGAGFEPQMLERRRRTRQQVGLHADERSRNVRGAFALRPEAAMKISGRPVVLVDDVLTTGSTVEACTRVLLRAGARQVDVLTFAIADPSLTAD